jgi:hypothetical protein
MSSTAIDQRPDGSVFIFYHGRQYRREPGGGWSRRRSTANGWKGVSDRRACRLERIDRRRDEFVQVHRFTRGQVARFPRLKRDPEAEAKKEQIRGLWAENQKVQAVNKQNRYELGKALDELHALRAHHGNGTYDRDVEALGIPKPTAWRIRNYYREVAGMAPVSQFVSFETNSPDGTQASPATSPSGGPGCAAEILRERAAKQKKITQVRLDPERHKIFHKKLKKLAVSLGTEGVSETTFKAITTYEVPACAK